jgi:Rap1a immunity proteins
MTEFKRAMAVAVCLLAESSAHAEFVTGDELSRACNEASLGAGLYCMAYIAGIFDARPDCDPLSISMGEAKVIVGRWLKDDPARQKLPAPEIVYKAIREKFPCSKP